jgi:hypothetical protein
MGTPVHAQDDTDSDYVSSVYELVSSLYYVYQEVMERTNLPTFIT